MKKLFTSLAICALCFSATAQDDGGSSTPIEKGKIKIGTGSSLGFSGGDMGTNFNINLAAGYMLTDEIMAGANFGVSAGSAGFGNTSLTTSFGAFGRYYMNNIFGQLSQNVNVSSNLMYTTTGFGAGYAYFVNDWLSVEPLARFDLLYANGNMGFQFGAYANIGIYF